MEFGEFYKSVLEQDKAPIVLCDLEHTILYMNPAAKARYANRGGDKLMGKNLMDCHNPKTRELIEKVLSWFSENPEHNIIYESRNDKENKDVYIVALRDGEGKLIGYYEKHEYRTNETIKFYDIE